MNYENGIANSLLEKLTQELNPLGFIVESACSEIFNYLEIFNKQFKKN
ncbi:hypothetical protein [Okeania sp. SIO2B9]|nr:hypothetical protein [Okeania sp. SIO2B9]